MSRHHYSPIRLLGASRKHRMVLLILHGNGVKHELKITIEQQRSEDGVWKHPNIYFNRNLDVLLDEDSAEQIGAALIIAAQSAKRMRIDFTGKKGR